MGHDGGGEERGAVLGLPRGERRGATVGFGQPGRRDQLPPAMGADARMRRGRTGQWGLTGGPLLQCDSAGRGGRLLTCGPRP
jgi:hypothetical protein